MVKTSAQKKKTGEIARRLIEHYGRYEARDGSPFDVLIATILSQNTTDKNSHRAFASLYSKYDTPVKLAKAPEKEIAELIRIGGLHEQKAKLIKTVAQLVIDEYGGTLDFVCDADPEAARKELLSIKGIGPKTADCVLLFSCGRDVIPVDTHVFRITKRLGIVPESASHEADAPPADGPRAGRRPRLCPRRPDTLRPGDLQSPEPATRQMFFDRFVRLRTGRWCIS